MPPKRKPEQHDKNKKGKSSSNGSATRPARSKTANSSRQGPEVRSTKSVPSWRLPKNASGTDYKTKIESLWKSMGNSRVGERQDAIKNGLIADPNKRTTLANAIRVVGTCQDMCPEFERIQRIRENAVDRAEKITIHGTTKVADELRMVKAFHRPDAGKEEQLPSDLRPPGVLQKTVRYLLDKVASPSTLLAEHHKFVWDRTRCIRNDFTIQASGRLEDIKITIQCYEEIARFHILSLHQMPKIGKHDYDAQQELEQLSATLLSLFELYDDNRGKYDAPRESEFRAYKLIIDIRSRTNDTFERVQTWPPRVRDSLHVQTAVQLCQASGYLLTDTATMLSPYSKALHVERAAYEKFWTILESPKVDYLMACAATVSFNEVRARTLESMIKVYRSGPNSRMQDISLEELTFALGLDSVSQTKKFFRDTGLQISQHSNGVAFLNVDELPGPLPKSAIASSDQIFSSSIVEAKRERRVFSAIYNGFDLAYCKENNLIDEAESDAEYDPDAEEVDSEDDEHEHSLFVEEDEQEEEKNEHHASSTSTRAFGNPFGKMRSREPSPQPATLFSGAFGQPSGAQPTSLFAQKTSTLAPSSNTFAKPSVGQNDFASGKQPEVASPHTGLLSQASSLFSEPSDAAPAEPAVFRTSENPPGFSATSTTKDVPAAGLFQWKKPVSIAPSDGIANASDTAGQPTGSITSISGITSSNQPSTALKPLFPFTFPAAVTENATATSVVNMQASKSSWPGIFSTAPLATAPLFSAIPKITSPGSDKSLTQSEHSLKHSETKDLGATPETLAAGKPAGLSSASHQSASEPLSIALSKAQPSSVAEASGKPLHPVASAINNSTSDALLHRLGNAGPATPKRRVVTQKQKDEILSMIAKDLVLGSSGLIEQFIEAQLGPIYDKAQRRVTRERTEARLEEIKHSLLGSKFLYAWKQKIDKHVQRKRATERRQRMRLLNREEFSREQSVSSMPSSVHEGGAFNRFDGSLKHLTRGFHETFETSTSDQRKSPMQKGKDGTLADSGLQQSNHIGILNAQSYRPSRHSRSQTLDSSTQASTSVLSSSSMPPPNRIRRSTLITQNVPRSFVGTGFVQSAALRGEAMDFARRSGSTTTTSSDYFRLKARHVDPSTRVTPSTRKRHRESGGSTLDGVLSKTRRLSESTASTISFSESTRELLAGSSLSDSARPLLNGQPQVADSATDRSMTPRYTDEEDALFEAARKLRETLVEDTHWMRSMREEQEKGTAMAKETAAQKRLREFKATPSKTSVRLRQTHASGLLPLDYFGKEESAKDKQLLRKDGAETGSPSMPSSTMDPAALSDRNPKWSHESNQTEKPNNLGMSVDDAIEL